MKYLAWILLFLYFSSDSIHSRETPKDEPIIIELLYIDSEFNILINNEKFKPPKAVSWLSELKALFGTGAFIDVRCKSDVPIGDVMDFLTKIKGWEWPNLEVRILPPHPRPGDFRLVFSQSPFLKIHSAKNSILSFKDEEPRETGHLQDGSIPRIFPENKPSINPQ